MKITIVTVYNSENSGSFLQAFALEQVLKNAGHEVRFLCRHVKGTSHFLFDRSRIVEIVKSILDLNFKGALIPLCRWLLYAKITKHFKLCKIDSDYYRETFLFILGSDTIWNFDDNYFRSKADVLTGSTFKGKRVMSYAASAANTDSKCFVDILSGLGNFDNLTKILVRDQHTLNLVKTVCSTPVQIVCDPTLICLPDVFDKISAKIKYERPYLLLYYTDDISEDFRKMILSYTNNNELDVISLMVNLKWCNKSYVGAPQYFVPLFKEASAVLTNTFHGCAFSLIYNKQFAVKDNNKNKVKELLEMYNVHGHMFREDSDFARCINIKRNDSEIQLIKRLREESINTLLATVKEEDNEFKCFD